LLIELRGVESTRTGTWFTTSRSRSRSSRSTPRAAFNPSGDFVFESGQDLSIGYESHDSDVVRLYLEQSFSFHVATPEAAVALKP
jgi:hypothetical protein